MSDGRTYWWAKDAAWWDRAGVAEVVIFHGAIGGAALDWLCCHAKILNDGGKVKSGYAAVAKGIGEAQQLDAVMDAVKYAADIGLLDDFEERDGTRFTCRISGWASDQEKALAARRQAIQRASRRVTVDHDESREQRQGQNRDSSRGESSTVSRAGPSTHTGDQT